MMLNEILNILKADSELYSLLGANVKDSHIYMNKGKADTCISYRYSLISSDGIKAQSKLEINCISPDYAKAESILNRVKQLLITVGNKQLNNDILNISSASKPSCWKCTEYSLIESSIFPFLSNPF